MSGKSMDSGKTHTNEFGKSIVYEIHLHTVDFQISFHGSVITDYQSVEVMQRRSLKIVHTIRRSSKPLILRILRAS